ncbi:polysaccharide pyruvyl transferase family protein [Mesorhizobium sp. LHD-90]|uniref:polysaccharide pyruvyl transferase family protein n=1 Tax=Mesorhizobium sp. LHD-90 TaxID=3071414 RepID=UPI0027E0BF1B|nr:polysaccharide pyruvyl transferase family protein [Mesorhizobium sp. LHD-90]MDQ6437373.1 polysaccharide pyruvyl transferase family protein [Mesorhizobium sp. LHD-90]
MNRLPPDGVALFGTFDVANYGDLLFPHVAAHLLGMSPTDLRCYSPRGGAPDWEDVVPARAVTAFNRDLPPALCLIGGGNIVHANPTPLADYAGAFPDPRFIYASLWLGASILAARTGAALAWNAPGVPSPLEGAWVRRLRDLALDAADLLCVRDEASRVYLGGGTFDIGVLPDTALKLGAVWPAAALADHARAAFESRGMGVPERWIVFHLNDRYIGSGLPAACAAAGRIAAGLGAVPVLVAIGPCHGDDALAREAATLFDGDVLVVDRPRGLKEIAGLIAHAQAYVGSSMHGLITALAYRRPGIAIARTRMVKFLGLLEQIGEPDRLQESWEDAERMATTLLQPLPLPLLDGLDAADNLIDGHGTRLRQLSTSAPAPSAVKGRATLRSAVSSADAPFEEWTRLDQALAEDEAAADDPDRVAQAIASALRGSAEAALGQRIADALVRWPNSVRLALLEAEWLERSGDVASAHARLAALQAKHPNNPWPVVRLVRLLAAQGELDNACALYEANLQSLTLTPALHRELTGSFSPDTPSG